jgi:hypothetical protein
LTPPPKNAKLNTTDPTTKKGNKQMTLGGYTYQVGDLFTTSRTGVTGRIEKFTPIRQNVTRVMLRLANNQTRFAMVKTH